MAERRDDFWEQVAWRREVRANITAGLRHRGVRLARALGAASIPGEVTIRTSRPATTRWPFRTGPKEVFEDKWRGWQLMQASASSFPSAGLDYDVSGRQYGGGVFRQGLALTTTGELQWYTATGVMSPNLVMLDTRALASEAVNREGILVQREQIATNGAYSDRWPMHEWHRMPRGIWSLCEPTEYNRLYTPGVYGTGPLDGMNNLATRYGIALPPITDIEMPAEQW